MHKSSSPSVSSSIITTSLRGAQLLNDPVLNKGTAFTEEERREFALLGKLPPQVETLATQVMRAYAQYQEQISDAHKNLFLQDLHATNRILFYKVVEEHLKEMLPILYTPNVARTVTHFSQDFRRPQGLYISYPERASMEEMLDAYCEDICARAEISSDDIKLIIATDGEGVLGIGDQGVGAIHIPIAKLILYTIFGGINPLQTLPIVLDVGTNNQELLTNPLYLGWRHPRLEQQEYDAFIAQFVAAVMKKFPNTFLHWEDFGRANAADVLARYRDKICSFNDDLQGTGVVTAAALLAALKATQQDWRTQRIVIFGAGTSGIGIAEQLVMAMQFSGMSTQEARSKIWLIDKQGLLTTELEQHVVTPMQKPFLRQKEEIDKWQLLRGANSSAHFISLHDVVKNLHPTVLIGCSTQGGTFTEEIVRKMAQHVPHPIIFPLSNPTTKCEAVPEDIVRWTDGKALVATGSPFAPVKCGNILIPITQCNNALAFPGIGSGVLAAQARVLTDGMLWAACQALATTSPLLATTAVAETQQTQIQAQGTQQDASSVRGGHGIDIGTEVGASVGAEQQLLLPPLAAATDVAQQVAVAVAMQAQRDGVAMPGISPPQLQSEEAMREIIQQQTWTPSYLPYKCSEKN